ncbi:MAG: hypothetical protein AB7Q81_12485 [Gammaproteobacteria bacterium]
MLAFLVTVRHPHNCNSYARVWRLLEDTLRSLLAQRSGAFRVVVVCNERRPLAADLAHAARIDWRVVEFPPPSPLRRAATGLTAARLDRGCKLAVAVLDAAAAGATHFMTCDADDFVADDLAGGVAAAGPAAPGWYLAQGYDYKDGRIAPRDDFDRHCGTSLILRTDLIAGPLLAAGLSAAADQTAILARAGHDFVTRLLGSHLHLREHCAVRGAPLAPWPARAAVRRLATGENHSDFRPRPPSAVDAAAWAMADAALVARFALPTVTAGCAADMADRHGPAAPECDAAPAGITRVPAYRSAADATVRARVVTRPAGAEPCAHDDPRHPWVLELAPRHRLLLTPLERWLWATLDGTHTVGELIEDATGLFPERGAILDGEVLDALDGFAARGLVTVAPGAGH